MLDPMIWRRVRDSDSKSLAGLNVNSSKKLLTTPCSCVDICTEKV